jgi:hypothetical protein
MKMQEYTFVELKKQVRRIAKPVQNNGNEADAPATEAK